MGEHHIALLLVAIIALGVGAQWLAWRIRLPAIILLVLAGLIVGPFTGWLNPHELLGETFRPLVSLCVAIILFEGGMNLHFHEMKVAAQGVKRLVYLGVPLAWCLATLAAHYVGGISWPVALVFGAIMVVTGPTVIMPLLRQARLNRRTASYFKWEGIVNDPIGALLAVLIFQVLVLVGAEDSAFKLIMQGLVGILIAGVVLGGLGGWLTALGLRRGWFPEYLKSPILLVLVLCVYVAANELQHEAGLLAVTVMGLVIGNTPLPGLQDLRRFKEYISVMLIAVVFILLTADLDVSVWQTLNWRGGALLFMVLFVVRPLTIWLATLRSDMDWRDRFLLGWIAPRGIVAAATAGIMGPVLAAADYPDAEKLLPLVFAVIILTVFAHGITLGPLARRLSLTSTRRSHVLIVGASPWSIQLTSMLKEMGAEVMLADSAWHNLREARRLGVPVFYGDILSEFAEESVELGLVTTALALTSNDAYNALVCNALAPEVGRNQVFQLPVGDGEEDPRGVASERLGRVAFSHAALFERLWRQHVQGWGFFRTRITEEYSYSDFLGNLDSQALNIAVQKPNGELLFASAQQKPEPAAGDSVLYYAPERAGPHKASDQPDESL